MRPSALTPRVDIRGGIRRLRRRRHRIMARDRLVQRRGRAASVASSDHSDTSNATTSNDTKKKKKPRHLMTEEELDDEFEAACERWCSAGIRIIFAAYTVFGFAVSSLEWAMRPTVAMDPALRLDGFNVVLTGGCAGIGLETARLLAARGARVAVGCRPRATTDGGGDAGVYADDPFAVERFGSVDGVDDVRSPEEARARAPMPGPPVVRYPLDLADFASVRAFAARVRTELETIDAVVHNAATTAACVNTTDGFEASLQTNYLAPVLLNRLLLPTLKANAKGAARVVHVTCAAAQHSKADEYAVGTAVKRCHPAVAYGDSKMLLERHSAVFASKFGKFGVVSNAVDPGPVVTDFVFKGSAHPRSRRFNPAAMIGWVTGRVTTAAFGPHGASKFFMRTVGHGAAAVAHVAASDATGGVGGRLYADTAGAFTRAAGCPEGRPPEDCGWVRPKGPRAGHGGFDQKYAARAAEREREDAAIWKRTSKVLEPWSEPLDADPA